MYSLIVVAISTAIVVALSLATLYYSGSAASDSVSDAVAAKEISAAVPPGAPTPRKGSRRCQP